MAMHGVVGTLEQPASARRISVRQIAKKLGLIAAVLGAVIVGAWYGYTWWTVGRFMETTDDAYVGGDVTTMASKVAGFVDTIAVTDNQRVKAGDLLVKLDDRDYRAQLARAEASVAAQEAALANRDAAHRLQTAVVDQANAEIAAATAEATRSQYDLDRYRTLSAERYASLQRFEQADADYKKAAAVEHKMQAALRASRHQLDVIDTERRQIEAALAQAKAERDLAGLNLSYTEIRSPIDGVIGNRSARVGAYATVGTQLLSIVPAHGLWVDANFKESQLAQMSVGQSVEITADVLPGHTFHGRIESLAPATGAQFSVIPPENATGNFTKIVQRVPVRIVLEGGAGELGTLRPGLSVVARVDERERAAAREARQ
jgi:membrane fusion protein, multidrug efflux system